MLLFLLASASLDASEAQPAHVAAVMPATATARIVRAVEFRPSSLAATEESLLRTAQVRERDGSLRTATLVEFY